MRDDSDWGSFLEAGQWNVDEDLAEEFLKANTERRKVIREYAHDLLKPKKIPPISRLLVCLTKLFSAITLWYIFDKRRGREKSRQGISRRLRLRFVKLGSTYIKLGQIISSGRGLFPKELVDEFALLRDRVPPESYIDIKNVIEEDYSRPLESIFSTFDREPIAAASIAQVHRATLVTGENVVVKVQRPRVGDLVRKDIKSLSWLAPRLVGRIPVSALANPPALVEVFTETIVEELDFRLEADNMISIAKMLATADQRNVVVPRPRLDLVTKRVLVMEQMHGLAFDDVVGIKDAGIDPKELLRAGLVAFAEGSLIHGIFHGDLHGGNLFILEDGKTALLDFGITGRFTESERRAFMRLLIAGITGNTRQQVLALCELGALPQDLDIDMVIKDLDLDGPVKDPTKMSNEQLAQEMSLLTKKLLDYGAKAPKELMLFVKNLMFLDGATATLAPDIDIIAEIQNVYLHLVKTHGSKIVNELGLNNGELKPEVDAEIVKSTFGVTDNVDKLTYEDIQKRRELIKKRMTEKRK